MLPTTNKVKYLVGSPSDFSKRTFVPFNPLVCDFLNDLSLEIMSSATAQQYPDVISFAFWCRTSNVQRLKREFSDRRLRLGRGLVFHIAPSNVPVNFAFSFVFSLLAGNTNVVRVPTKNFRQTEVISAAIGNVLTNQKYDLIKKGTALVLYERNDKITSAFSGSCNVRIIWGGTQTIRDVRSIPIQEQAIDIV